KFPCQNYQKTYFTRYLIGQAKLSYLTRWMGENSQFYLIRVPYYFRCPRSSCIFGLISNAF
ncbi:MAG: hypothetical protein ACI9JY_001877, partial [Saprospiraceae bacterium]